MPTRTAAALLVVLVVAFLSLSLTSATVSQYLINGDFETGDQTGWSASTPSAVTISTAEHHGNYCISIGQVTTASTIDELSDLTAVTLSQTVQVAGTGRGYTLQWSQMTPKSYGLQQFTVGYTVNSGSPVTVSGNPVVLPNDVTAYLTFNASLPAVGAGNHALSIQFSGQSAYGAFLVDDVILSDA